jgi:hypothetical protein
VRLGDDEASPGEDPADRRGRRTVTVASLEVVGDGRGPSLVAAVIEVIADPDDFVRELIRDPCR